MAGITIKNLSKTFGGKHSAFTAVRNVSMAVGDNQFLTLLGPSGCGKTTTLRLIAGYVTPDAGSIHVGDRLVSTAEEVTPPDRRGMGMVFQNYAVWPHKTVFENVVFGLKLRKFSASDARDKVAKALDHVNLTGLESRFPNELSGGQQQRVALARSLVVEPEILLLDEPLSNLDAKLRERMRTELKQLQRRTGITFVYVTHDQAEALALSDRVAVMHAGEVQQFGTPQDVYSRPANRTVADFMGLVNFIEGRLTDDGRVRIGETPLALNAPQGTAPGSAVDVAVRPEDLRLSRGQGTGGLGGVVAEQVFLGNIVECWIRLDAGPLLRAQTHPSEAFAEGERASVTIDPARASVFPRSDAARAAA
jgi:iron(III) transport system ATP-binding protein